MFTNARGINSKKDSLMENLSVIKPQILSIIETQQVGKCSLKIPNYEVIQRNRKTKGGGILVAVEKSSGIEYTVTKIEEAQEIIWLKIKDKNISWRLATVYGLQESQASEEEVEQWFYSLESELATCNDEPILIIGDFNAHVGNDNLGIEGNKNKINRNGRKLREIMERRNLTLLNNTDLCKGLWTRIGNEGKSAIDLAVCNEEMLNLIHDMKIDEERDYVLSRIKKVDGKHVEVPSDHNTIVINVEGEVKKTISKEVVWNMTNKQDQLRFKRITESTKFKEQWKNSKDINRKYNRWEKQLKSLMHQSFKRSTIKPGQGNSKTREIINQKRKIRRRMGELEKLQQNDKDEYTNLKLNLNKKIEEIAEEQDKDRANRIKKRMDAILMTGADRRNEIWKIRKKATNTKEPKLAIKNENGELLTDKADILNRYNEYYTNLLQPRPPNPGSIEYINQSEKLFETCKSTLVYDNTSINQEFTMKEIEDVIRDTKAGKCPGPDEIQSEILIHAGTSLKQSLLKMINALWMAEELPDSLKELNVKSMYKGKGSTSDLKNQRGIFLGNEILKFYEKLISRRITPKIEENISECQAGGRPSRNIADQIFILRSIWNHHSFLNRGLYLQFLDLIKAFDKMILKAVMLDLWKCDVKGRIWRNIYKINKTATLSIKTPFGNTSKFEVAENLKQGSVLATQMASLHTDGVSKLFINKGLHISYGNLQLNNLLFQDDILRIQQSADEMNKSNKIYEVYQHNNRMEFHEDKSVYMSTKDTNPIYLNNKELKITSSCKYLGEILTDNNCYNQMIETRTSAVRGTTAELNAILHEIPANMKITAILSYYHAIIPPKLLLNSETWSNLTKKNISDIETAQNTCIKRLLHIPLTCPNAILRSELGMWSVEGQIMYKKCMFLQRILKQKNTVTRQVLQEQLNLPGPTWINEVNNLMSSADVVLTHSEIETISKYQWKKLIKAAISKKETKTLAETKETAKKGKYLETNISCKNYLSKLSLEDARTILKIRTNMIEVRANFKNKYTDLNCPICNDEIETTNHLLSCQKYKNKPLKQNILQLIFKNSNTQEQISAMAEAAHVCLERIRERDRLQEEEGASTSAEAEDNKK